MNFKKVVIFVLLFSSTWAVNSNDPRNDDDEINPENELLSSSDESDDGKLKFLILCYKL